VKRFLLVATIGYFAILGAILYGLFTARASAKANLSTAESQRAWDEWRTSIEQQKTNNQSVRRSISKSTQPPTLILLRDHFGITVAASLTVSTVLYWTLALFARGAATSSIEIEDNRKGRKGQ
jgi:hypothetical protein